MLTHPIPEGLATVKNPGALLGAPPRGSCQKKELLPSFDATSAAAQKRMPKFLGQHLSGDTTQLTVHVA